MGVRFLRFDILPNRQLGDLDEDGLGDRSGEERGELEDVGGEGGEGGGVAMQDNEAELSFCHITEPGNAGWRWN